MTTDLTRYVNLRYGVDNEGNTVIGPQRPNASVNPAPDTKGGSTPATLPAMISGAFPRSMPAVRATESMASSFCRPRSGWTPASPGTTLRRRTSALPAANTACC